MRKLLLMPAGALVAAFAVAAFPGIDYSTEFDSRPAYQLAKVSLGSAVARIIAAGNVQPIRSVAVGSQVSGQIKEILVDYNDAVTEGQPIARLDPELFAARVELARAQVEVATRAMHIGQDEVRTAEAAGKKASAERARGESEVKRAEVAMEHARRQLDRKEALIKGGSVSASDLDDARAAFETMTSGLDSARAEVASDEAQVEQANAELAVARSRVVHAEAQVRVSEAAFRQAEAELERTVIRAPMAGTVIERSVAAGQTVAASLNAPTLFTIGDLSAVVLEISVDEADIGSVRSGQKVTFSVDAYPDQVFTARITQIRKSPRTQENVVTYIVLAQSDNADLLLFPGMTANAEIITNEIPDALQVPSAALRYQPHSLAQSSGPCVWVVSDESGIHPVPIRVEGTSGNMTQVSGDLSLGQNVVIGELPEKPETRIALLLKHVSATVAGWIEPVHAALAKLRDV
jgi:HlyD family secretion protein